MQKTQMQFYLPNTRIARQSGGVFLPQLLFKGRISNHLSASKWHIPNLLQANPPAAAVEHCIGLEDIRDKWQIDPFFFLHSEAYIPMTPEFLWPSHEEDEMFATLIIVCNELLRKYFEEPNLDICDKDRGIIDRGFY